jgi:hypothetical protein
VHPGSALASYTLPIRPRLINRVKETERDDDAERAAQVTDGFTVRGLAQLIGPCMMAEGLNTCLTDSVAGQFTVERLIDSALVGRSEDPVLFHAGD